MRKKQVLGLIGMMVSIFLVSCEQQTQKPMNTSSPEVAGHVVNDTLPVPVVTYLADFEPPTVRKAAKPIYDSLSTPFGEGIPDITRYTTLDGLPQSITYRVLQGSDGTMWFLSVENLSKFDGTSFTTYNRVNGLLEDSYASRFLLDSQNRIWVGTDRGISVFNGRSFTTYTLDEEGNELGLINSIIEDNEGSLWIGSTENGLFLYKNNKFTQFTTDDGLKDNQISGLIIDRRGHLIITTNEGLAQYNGTNITPYETIPTAYGAEKSRLLLTDSRGDIWFQPGAGKIGKYNGSEVIYYSNKDIFDDVAITDVIEDTQGHIWFSTTNGLSYFNGSTFVNYSNSDLGIAKTSGVSSIAFDQEGSLWAVIPNEGVIKINRNLSFPEIPDGDAAISVIPDPSGDIWIQTDKGYGKYLENRIAYYIHDLLANENYSSFQDLTFDKEGNLWFTVLDNRIERRILVNFDGSNYTIYGPEQGLELASSCGINDIDGYTNLLRIVCEDKIIEFDGEQITLQNFLPNITIDTFLLDTKGNRWFATDNNGIYKYNGEQLSQFSIKTGLVSNNINSITEDPLGNIWASIDYGNARITNTSLSSFDAQDGLANLTAEFNSDTVNDVLWFGTISGLISLDFDQLNDVQPRFRRYNYLTGFSIGPIVDPKFDIYGRVWGVAFNNLFKLNYPAVIDMPETVPYIKNIQLNNQPVSWLSLSPSWAKTDSMAAINEMGLKFKERLSDEQLETQFNSYGDVSFDSVSTPDFIPTNLSLPYTNNTISFEFSTVSPTYGKSVQYQYRLQGYDDRWSTLGNKKDANFGNLPEGSYTFQVKALNTAGNLSEISYPFTVRPPWQRTLWAYMLYILGLGMGVFGFISWRTKSLSSEKHRLEEEVSKRTSELQNANSQLGASLSDLKSAQDQLIQQEKLASLGQLTAGIAHEIKNPLNFVNNFSELSVELIEETKDELSAVSDQLSAEDREKVDEALEILNDIGMNLRKIHEHGSRADSIVKSMLEHSRGGTGKLEPTDLNTLVKEFVNLSFHGMRAGKNPINVDLQFKLDESIKEVPLIAEDFSRVVVNLSNNAFDAMREKLGEKAKVKGEKYSPKLIVRTFIKNQATIIEIEDNALGIPNDIKDKILQPFFTTKKGTEGTGLGLSITNDIIKAHGGVLEVSTNQNEGTCFTIKLSRGG